MFLQPWLPSHHLRSFLVLAGMVSALVNAASFAVLLLSQGVDANLEPYALIMIALIALSAFASYASFPLLISARSASWMLGHGILRWFRVPLTLSFGLVLMAHGVGNWLAHSHSLLLTWGFVALALQIASLMLLRKVAGYVNNLPGSRRRAVFLGNIAPDARELNLRLQRSPILGMHVTGFYAGTPPSSGESIDSLPYLGNYDDAVQHLMAGRFEAAILTQHIHDDRTGIARIVDHLYDSTASIYLMPMPQFLGPVMPRLTEIAGIPLLTVHSSKILGLSRLLKRAMDVVVAAAALLVLWPLLLAIACIIRLDSPGPILFRQTRYGERGTPITILKFRSMKVEGSAATDGVLRQATMHDDRVTRVGRILRRSSLDELPQLFNVLSGSMSVVGPRPHAAQHNELYRARIPGYMLRHSVKPGMTGWAQIHGLRGETDTLDKMERRIEFDRYYIMNWSLLLDLKILLRTVPAVLAQVRATY
ncbi:undecaprenyl-phosphate glucose phosphotransferase [Cupriavidus sp. USMAHM13]|uniref:undecaprenyl-phosphate glucose phosphotransferase n=1 Tax=Cupriavidus sp. USMAHM13 TaxID=1389192 RepID=UPI0009F2CD37|nr:undecaprenyl-phosphate glucose phosphotransferase [Cupriavidus sp. USMAHM13]